MNTHTNKYLAIAIISAITYGCGGGGSDSPAPAPANNGTGGTTTTGGTGGTTTGGTGGTTTTGGTGGTTTTGGTGGTTTTGGTLTYSPALQAGFSTIGLIVKSSNDLIAISGLGSVSRSTNGSDWSDGALSTITTGTGLRASKFLNNKYIAVGENASSSVDLVTWSNSLRPNGSLWPNTLFDVAYGGNKYLAIGEAIDFVAGQPVLISSPDGIAWTPQPSAALESYNIWTGIAHSGTKWVALGHRFGPVSIETASATSPDGVSWTVTPQNFIVAWQSLIYANNRFIALANVGKIYSSTDGTTWTPDTVPSSNNILRVACGGPNNTCVAATSGVYPTLLRSSVAGTWETTNFTSIETAPGVPGTYALPSEGTNPKPFVRSIAYTGSKWLVTGERGLLIESTDGLNWTRKLPR
jgi:hypothetical protein